MARHYHRRLLPAVAVILALVGVASASARPIDPSESAPVASTHTAPSPCSEVCSGGAATVPQDAWAHSIPASSHVAASPTVAPVATTSGFHWGDAGIGAGGALALAACLVAGSLIVLKVRRRSTQEVAQQTT